MSAISKLYLGTAFVLAFPVVGHTQDDPPAAESDNAIGALTGEILVSANKKKDVENVQDVPLSVAAFNRATLEALQLRDLQSLTTSAPNVSLDQIGTTKGVANFSIRGLGINSSIPSIDPTVGVFVDGVYFGINNGVVLDTFDLDSVEILRGPQGILFGRNTTGGAVLVNTGNPTDDFQARFRAAVEMPVDDGRGKADKTVMATISGPIAPGMLNFKVAGFYNHDGGYFKNLATGRAFGKSETKIVRGALTFNPDGAFRVTGKIEYLDTDAQGPAGQNHGFFARDSFDFAINSEGAFKAKAWTGSLRADLDVGFGDGVITNIFGYRNYKDSSLNVDIDSLPRLNTLPVVRLGSTVIPYPLLPIANFFTSDAVIDQEQFSNELRYAGSFGPLDITVGGYYFKQDVGYDERRNLSVLLIANPPVLPPGVPPLFYGGGKQDHEVLGAFAQGDFAVTDRLKVIAGIRWSKETKDADVTYVRPRNACSVIGGTCPTAGFNQLLQLRTGGLVNEPNGFSNKRSWRNWSPKLALQYEFSDNGQVYGGWTRGYRSGGYNFRITDVAVFLGQVVPAQGGPSFDEEKVDSYEAGVKWQTADRRLTLNGAVFLTKIKDMQRELNTVGTAGVVQNILNTADAEIKGFEVEGRFAITDNLLISGNAGYIDAKYKDIKFDISGSAANISTGVVDAADFALALPRVPEWTYGASLTHDLDLGDDGNIVSRVSVQHRDRIAYTDNNFGWIPAYDDLEASVTWAFGDDKRFSMTIFGKNLLDEVQFGGDTQLPFGAGPLSDGTNSPFDPRPAAGTFSPLSKGRRLGLSFGVEF